MKGTALKPVDFEERNVTFVAEQCGDLPAHQAEDQITTCWEVSDEMLQEITDNRRVWLTVFAKGQPPVLLFSGYPFEDKTVWPDDIEEKMESEG